MPVPIVAPTPNSVSWKQPDAALQLARVRVGPGLLRHHPDRLAPQDLLLQRRPRPALTDAIDLPLVDPQLMSRASRSAHVSRRTTSRAAPSRHEHHRDAAGSVVVVRHREAVGPGRRDGDQVADARRVEADAVDEHVAALAVAAHERDVLAVGRLEPVGDPGLEALVEERDLEIVAHAAVDGHEGELAALDGDDAIERRSGGRDHAAAGLDDHLRLRGQVLARGADQPVEVLADRRRPVVVGVARAEAAAEVVDRELAERGDRRHRLRERLDVQDLGPDVDVHALHAQLRAALDAPDQLGRGRRRQPELRSLVAGQHVGVRVGRDARDDAHEDVLRAAPRHRRLEPVDVVAVVDDDQAEAVLDDHRDLVVALGVAVQHQQRRVGARLERGDDLAAARDVEPEALLDHHALDGGARERLRGEHDARASASGRRARRRTRAHAHAGRLGDDQRRRLELGGERVGAAAADA